MPDFEVRISGSGGQGILLAGRILADALGHEALNVAQSQSYEPTSRGGLSRADLVASDAEVDYPLASDLDYLVIWMASPSPRPTTCCGRVAWCWSIACWPSSAN